MKPQPLCILVATGLAFVAPLAGQDAPALPQPELSLAGFEPPVSKQTSTDGTVQLSWRFGKDETVETTVPEGAVCQVEEHEQTASKDDTLLLDAGSHLAAALSGRDDGHYHYRVRAVREDSVGPWSNVVEVHVKHHSLALAFTVFGIGAVVFLATAGLVLLGHRNARGTGR